MRGAMLIMCYKPRMIIISIWYSYNNNKKKSPSVFRLYLLCTPFDIDILEPGTCWCLLSNPSCTLHESKIGSEGKTFKFESWYHGHGPRVCVTNLWFLMNSVVFELNLFYFFLSTVTHDFLGPRGLRKWWVWVTGFLGFLPSFKFFNSMMSVCKLRRKWIWRCPRCKYQRSRDSSCDQIFQIWRTQTPAKYWKNFHICEKLLGKNKNREDYQASIYGKYKYNGILSERKNWTGISTELTLNVFLFELVRLRVNTKCTSLF